MSDPQHPPAAPRDRCRVPLAAVASRPARPADPHPRRSGPGVYDAQGPPEYCARRFLPSSICSVPASGGKTRPGAHPRGHPRSLDRLADMDAALRRVSGSRSNWAGRGPHLHSRPPSSPCWRARQTTMASGLPITAILLASVAGSTVLAVALAPPTPWLAPDMRPLALGLSAAWAAWRLLALDRALAQRRAWHQAPGWMVAPEALPAETAPAW